LLLRIQRYMWRITTPQADAGP